VESLYDLLSLLPQSAPKPLATVLLAGLQDWRGFFAPHLAGVEGHSQAHYFLIERDTMTKRITCRAKEHSSLSSELGPPVEVMTEMPSGLPGPLQPTLDPLFEQVQQGIQAFLDSSLLSPSAKAWYQYVMDNKDLGAVVTGREAGKIGEQGYLERGGNGTNLAVSIIRGAEPAPSVLPSRVQEELRRRNPAHMYLAQHPDGGAVELRNVRAAATRFRSSRKRAREEEKEGKEQQSDGENGPDDKLKEETQAPPESDYTLLKVAQLPLPSKCFVIVRVRRGHPRWPVENKILGVPGD
jgi:hypothetical protein